MEMKMEMPTKPDHNNNLHTVHFRRTQNAVLLVRQLLLFHSQCGLHTGPAYTKPNQQQQKRISPDLMEMSEKASDIRYFYFEIGCWTNLANNMHVVRETYTNIY